MFNGAQNWNVGNQTVVGGDCLAGLRGQLPGSIDVIVTSPPYNIGVAYGTYRDSLSPEAYLDWLGEVGGECLGVLADGGSLFLNVGGTSRNPLLPMRVALLFCGLGFVLQNDITWVKSISIGDDSFGHFKPINSPRYLNNTNEKVFHFTKAGDVAIDRLAVGVPYMDKGNIRRWEHAKQDKRCAGNTWFIPYETVRSKAQKFSHPAAFPVALAERCIALHGGRDLRVLDPFLGVGTTLLAAQHLEHRGIGFEIDEDYALAAVHRLRVHAANIQAERTVDCQDANALSIV